jgi:hypothetical protein
MSSLRSTALVSQTSRLAALRSHSCVCVQVCEPCAKSIHVVVYVDLLFMPKMNLYGFTVVRSRVMAPALSLSCHHIYKHTR